MASQRILRRKVGIAHRTALSVASTYKDIFGGSAQDGPMSCERPAVSLEPRLPPGIPQWLPVPWRVSGVRKQCCPGSGSAATPVWGTVPRRASCEMDSTYYYFSATLTSQAQTARRAWDSHGPPLAIEFSGSHLRPH